MKYSLCVVIIIQHPNCLFCWTWSINTSIPQPKYNCEHFPLSQQGVIVDPLGKLQGSLYYQPKLHALWFSGNAWTSQYIRIKFDPPKKYTNLWSRIIEAGNVAGWKMGRIWRCISFWTGEVSSLVYREGTTPKTNMEPQNHPFEKENHLPPTSIFWFHVRFRWNISSSQMILACWWFQPIFKNILVKMDHFPK